MNPEPGGLDYLIRNPTARVIRGCPEITQAVIDASPPRLEQRFTAGVLNGCPRNMSFKQEQSLIDELERQFLVGRGRESLPWCVVAHDEEEKHIVIPNFDPVFRKVVHPYVDRIDRHGLCAWVEHYSLRHELTLPHDKLRTEPDFSHMRLAEEDVEFLREIWAAVSLWKKHGMLNTRDDLKLLLTGAGYEIRCDKRNGGPLEQPVVVGPRGNPLRLRGAICYRPDYGMNQKPDSSPDDTVTLAARLATAHSDVEEHLEFRAWHLVGRLFGSKEQSRVRKGLARKHLSRLYAQKLKADRRITNALPIPNLKYLIEQAEAHKAGIKPVILDKRSIRKSVQRTPAVEDGSIPPGDDHAPPVHVDGNDAPPAISTVGSSVENHASPEIRSDPIEQKPDNHQPGEQMQSEDPPPL